MSERPSLDNYIDVAERIVAFNEKWPDGTLQTIDWKVEQVGDRSFIVYRAAAYRTPNDERPGHGTAWEPFPGLTPYTKNSELMNAETAAWGRAIVACGIVANRKLASRQEVRARQEEQAAERQPANGHAEHVTAEDIKALQSAAKGLKLHQIKLALTACGIPIPEPFGFEGVPKAKAALLAEALAQAER